MGTGAGANSRRFCRRSCNQGCRMNRAIFLVILPALALAACSGVPKPRDGTMGVLMFKPVFAEDRFNNVTGSNGIQSGMSSRMQLEITLQNRSTQEDIVRSITTS